jgi:acetolactate synthase-1/2/3 large subunit
MVWLAGRMQEFLTVAGQTDYPLGFTNDLICSQFMEATGAEIVVRCLAEEGVEFVFGYPGGAVLNI